MRRFCLPENTRFAVAVAAAVLLAGALFPASAVQGALPGTLAATNDGESESKSTANRIAKLIEQLGDKEYLTRQAAQEKLLRLGPDAFDALIAAESNDDIEIASRAKYLLQQIPLERDSDSPAVKQILRSYSLLDEAGRVDKIRQLAGLPQDQGIAALCRLIRYERSPIASKQGALLLLSQLRSGSSDKTDRAKSIATAMAGSTRPAARWLLAEIHFKQDPESALVDFDKLIDEEMATLENSPTDTNSEIVLTLERRQVDALLKREHRDRALAVMRKMIAAENGEPESLERLTDWLIKQQAYELVDEEAARFQNVFHTQPVLMYFLAEVRSLQGQKDQAEEVAKQASKLIPANDADTRNEIAGRLWKRGLFSWSEQEFRRVIDSSTDKSAVLIARKTCADILHDLDRNQDAADLLEKFVAAIDNDPNLLEIVPQYVRQTPQQIRGEFHYYRALQYEKSSDREKQWSELEKSIAQDPQNADVLIALYRASADNPARRRRALDMIQTTAQQWQNLISNSGNDSSEQAQLYNQYAWLVGNTEGDFDRAIQYSQKSIEIIQRFDEASASAGFIDTLAHCYAGKGDYENALKNQNRAAELDPHSMAIVRAVEEFKAKLAETKKSKP